MTKHCQVLRLTWWSCCCCAGLQSLPSRLPRLPGSPPPPPPRRARCRPRPRHRPAPTEWQDCHLHWLMFRKTPTMFHPGPNDPENPDFSGMVDFSSATPGPDGSWCITKVQNPAIPACSILLDIVISVGLLRWNMSTTWSKTKWRSAGTRTSPSVTILISLSSYQGERS